MESPSKKWSAPRGFRIILASASPRRAHLLRKAGLSFEVIHPEIDEKQSEETPHLTAAEMALNNAYLKARVISAHNPESWVLGADTVVVINGDILGKPEDMEDARRIFEMLNGRTHRVVTAVFLMRERPFHQMPFYDVSLVTFNKLTPRERDEYLAAIDPLDKAGAYSVQDRSETVINKIEGSVSNVMGLPMEKLLEVLERISRHSSGKLPRPGGYGLSPRSSPRSAYMLKSWR